MKNTKKLLSGTSLVEVMIALSIFTIAFGGILVTILKSRNLTENTIIKFSALHYAQSLLEIIQSYPYEDPSYPKPVIDPNNATQCANVFGLHDTNFSNGFDVARSGVYINDPNVIARNLNENQIGLRYHPTSLPANPTPLIPFTPQDTVLRPNERLCSMEDDDIDGNTVPVNGIYTIKEADLQRNIFGLKTDGTVSDDLAKYYFADDVDDFDGYVEVREIMPNVNVTYKVSVMNVYTNRVNFPVTYIDTNNNPVNKTIIQNSYAVMQQISIANFPSGINFTDALNPVIERNKHAIGYYNQTLFKKVTVSVSWTYPPGSNVSKLFVIDGGKVNPKGQA